MIFSHCVVHLTLYKNKTMNLENFAQQGTKFCEGKCNKQIIMTESGPVIICNGCKRIVIDNRKK